MWGPPSALVLLAAGLLAPPGVSAAGEGASRFAFTTPTGPAARGLSASLGLAGHAPPVACTAFATSPGPAARGQFRAYHGMSGHVLPRPILVRPRARKGGGALCTRAQVGDGEAGGVDVNPLQAGAGAWAPYLGLMAASGAMLGPFLDGYHSAFGVLEYTVPKPLIVGGTQLVVTDFWVPPLFALAAVILGTAYPILDHAYKVVPDARKPSGPAILACIAFFCAQYYSSGLLYSQGAETWQLHAFLAVTAAACLAVWDRTLTGATMAVVTGVAGPLVELGLLKGWPALFGSDLYHYTDPDFMRAIPLWIGWVYACGAPAVGNLGRGFWESGKGAGGDGM